MKLGNIAQGDDFFDRKRELEDLQRYLRDDHIALVGPRRLGKSSLLVRLQEILHKQGALTAYLDVQGVKTVAQFLEALDQAFPDHSIQNHLRELAKRPAGVLKKIKKLDLKLPTGAGGVSLETQEQSPPETPWDWTPQAQALQKRLLSAPAIILIDEFPVFLETLIKTDQTQAETFLAWLRAWRQHPDMAGRFIYSGSIGLNALLERHGLHTHFNDPVQMELGPFTRNAAEAMLCHFARQQGWTLQDAAVACLCDRVGWLSPYYLNLLLNESFLAARDRWDETRSETGEIEPQDIEAGYERLLTSRSRFSHWAQRLRNVLPTDEYPLCQALLTAVATSQDGLTLRQLHNRLAKQQPDPDRRERQLGLLLSRLGEEGYLSAPDAQGRLRFLSFPLRDWWRRNHA